MNAARAQLGLELGQKSGRDAGRLERVPSCTTRKGSTVGSQSPAREGDEAQAGGDYVTVPLEGDEDVEGLTPEQWARFIGELEERMREAARKFEFEKVAQLRDRVKALKMGEG